MKTFLERVKEDLDNAYIELYFKTHTKIANKDAEKSGRWFGKVTIAEPYYKETEEELTEMFNGKRI